MKIGILDLQGYPARSAWDYLEGFWSNKQFINLTCQAVSVWCRRQGHEAHYACYYGWGDPYNCLPHDLDMVFISCHSYLSPLAYALSRRFRQQGVLTVLGGPHAKAYPQDSLRFFDLVVGDCDEALVAEILRGYYPPGTLVSSDCAYDDIPTIEERLPELHRSAFLRSGPHPGSFIPMMASMGCPFNCNFCVDWDTPYRPLPLERLAADLRYASQRLPGVKLFFHDPNFGVRFDETMQIFESIPPGRRNQYGIECSLNSLRPERIARLRATNCEVILPSVESWSKEYAGKVGVRKLEGGPARVEGLAEAFNALTSTFIYVGTNFIFGLDSDQGDEPFELTKQFMRQAPLVWPILHIPMPYGGTPLQAGLREQGRILRRLPFMFYKVPYLAMLLKNYDPLEYYEKMTDLFAFSASAELFQTRMKGSRNPLVKGLHILRTGTARRRQRMFASILERLRSDAQFLAFQRGQPVDLPPYYAQIYRRVMGKYAELLPVEEMTVSLL